MATIAGLVPYNDIILELINCYNKYTEPFETAFVRFCPKTGCVWITHKKSNIVTYIIDTQDKSELHKSLYITNNWYPVYDEKNLCTFSRIHKMKMDKLHVFNLE